MDNKKVRNATKSEYDGQTFDSKLEVTLYKLLKEHHISFTREPKMMLMEGFRSSVPFYDGMSTVPKVKVGDKVRDWTYSPDFQLAYRGWIIYVEAKGMPNDVYPLKTKMFRKYLEENENENTQFWVVRSKSQLVKLLNELEWSK